MQTANDSLMVTIAALIAKFVPPESQGVALTPATALVDELGIDSARLVDIVLDVEDAFRITIADEEIDTVRTVGGLVELVSNKTHKNGAQ